MFPFFETLLIRDGRVPFFHWHALRAMRTRRLQGWPGDLEWHRFFSELPREGEWRARVIYGRVLGEIQIQPYRFIPKTRLILCEAEPEYGEKRVDRGALEKISATDPAEDVIIVKKGLVTDTTIANIALYDGKEWVTPKKPLLRGTARTRYLEAGWLKEREIPAEGVEKYETIALMNALSGFYVVGKIKKVVR